MQGRRMTIQVTLLLLSSLEYTLLYYEYYYYHYYYNYTIITIIITWDNRANACSCLSYAWLPYVDDQHTQKETQEIQLAVISPI